MKQSKHISDEELAAYLDKMLANQSMPLDAINDIDTLEVLSVSREALKDSQSKQKITSLPSWDTISHSAMLNSMVGAVPFAQAGFLGDICANEEIEIDEEKDQCQ